MSKAITLTPELQKFKKDITDDLASATSEEDCYYKAQLYLAKELGRHQREIQQIEKLSQSSSSKGQITKFNSLKK